MSFFLFCLAVAQLQCSDKSPVPDAVKLRVAVFDFDETLSVGTFLPKSRQVSDHHDGFGDTGDLALTLRQQRGKLAERSFGREALGSKGFEYGLADAAALDSAGAKRWLPSAEGRLAKLRAMLQALKASGVVSVVMTYNQRGASPVLNMLRAAELDDYFIGVYNTHLVEGGRNIPSGFVKVQGGDAQVWIPCEADAQIMTNGHWPDDGTWRLPGTWEVPVGVGVADRGAFNPNSGSPLVLGAQQQFLSRNGEPERFEVSKAVAIQMMMTDPTEYFPTGIAEKLEMLPLESRLAAAVLVDDKAENQEFLPRFCLVPKEKFPVTGSLGGVGFLDGSDYNTLLEAYPTPVHVVIPADLAPSTGVVREHRPVHKKKSKKTSCFACFGF